MTPSWSCQRMPTQFPMNTIQTRIATLADLDVIAPLFDAIGSSIGRIRTWIWLGASSTLALRTTNP